MANAAIRTAHIQDTTNLYDDIKNGTLPAVSFVKPSGLVDGQPASSKLANPFLVESEELGKSLAVHRPHTQGRINARIQVKV
jgi:hypothetical protein